MGKTVHIVGAGFSGLTAAYYLQRAGSEKKSIKKGFEKAFKIVVYEKEQISGGLIASKRTNSGIVETAANAILYSCVVEDLARDIGIQLVPANAKARRRFIYRVKAKRWPLSLSESVRLFSGLAYHYLRGTIKPEANTSETITSWGNSVLGEGATANLLVPALAGIYAGDPSRMDASLVLGSLFESRKKKKNFTLRGSVAPANGMGEWIEKLTDQLRRSKVEIRMGTEFDWSSQKEGDLVILAGGLRSSGQLLKVRAPKIAKRMDRLESLSIVSATCFFDRSTTDINGFGCLFAPGENMNFLGVLFNSDIFPNRSDHFRSETWIGGGAKGFNILNCTDKEIMAKIRLDRERLGQGWSKPKSMHICRWPNALPHFTGDLRRFLESDAKRELAGQGIYLHGNFMGRIGLSSIVERSAKLAEILC